MLGANSVMVCAAAVVGLGACAAGRLSSEPPPGVTLEGAWKLDHGTSDDPQKIIERVRYGDRGEGCLVRYEGVATWYSVYHQRGTEHRRTTKETDVNRARKASVSSGRSRFISAKMASRHPRSDQ